MIVLGEFTFSTLENIHMTVFRANVVTKISPRLWIQNPHEICENYLGAARRKYEPRCNGGNGSQSQIAYTFDRRVPLTKNNSRKKGTGNVAVKVFILPFADSRWSTFRLE